MQIQEPADKLAKQVGRPLKFKIGNRDTTFFTKSTEYGKLIENNHNDYLQQEQAKHMLRESFVQSFNIGSDNGTDKRSDAVEDPETVQQNIDAAQE